MKKFIVALLTLAMLGMGAPASAAEAQTTHASKKTAKAKKPHKTVAKRHTVKKHVVAKNKSATQRKPITQSESPTKSKSASNLVAKPMASKVVDAPNLRIDYGEALSGAELNLQSAAALVVNQNTGEALYAKNPDLETPIASITKLMTAVVTLDAELAMSEKITIDDDDVDRLKHTSSRLRVGTTLTRGELMHLALIASENRAAAALSRSYPGGRFAFVAAMNRKARDLGMRSTYYVDGTGLNSSNRSTAADLARLVDAAYRYPKIREITSTGSYDLWVPATRMVKVRENGKIRRVERPVEQHLAFNNTNLLTRDQEWDIGVSKTGYINEAGHCLVMQTRIAGEKVIIVLLDSWGKLSRIGDANRIRRWLENGAASHVASRQGGKAV